MTQKDDICQHLQWRRKNHARRYAGDSALELV